MTKPPIRLRHTRRSCFAVVALTLISAALFLPGLGGTIINREQELRVALTARTMADGGSWLIPRYQGAPRLRKPPLMYWLVASAFEVAGTTRSLFAARLPSALAGIGFTLATYVFGCFLMGRRRAWLAALVAATSFIILRQARLAETDVMLSLFTMMSACFGYLAMTRSRPWRWWLYAGLAGGLGFMTKGPAALALPLLAWVAFALTRPRRWTRVLSSSVIPGILAFALVALPWYLAIMFAGRENAAAEKQIGTELTVMLAESHHAGPIYYYFYTLLHALAPWSLLLPVAVALGVRRAWHHAGVRFILLWFFTALSTLSLISSKQIHYTTLLVAPCALLMGWFLGFGLSRVSSWRRTLARGYVMTLLLLLGAAGVMLVAHVGIPASWPRGVCRTFGALAAAAAMYGLLPARRMDARIFATVTVLGLLVALYSTQVAQRQEKHALLPQFLGAMKSQIISAPHVFTVGPFKSIIEFYSPRPLTYADTLEVARKKARPGDLILVTGNKLNPFPDHWGGLVSLADQSEKGVNAALLAVPGSTP